MQDYDLAGVTDIIGVPFKVLAKQAGTNKFWLEIRSYRYDPNMPGDFASGKALMFFEGGFPGLTVRVFYKAPFSRLVNLTDDVQAVSEQAQQAVPMAPPPQPATSTAPQQGGPQAPSPAAAPVQIVPLEAESERPGEPLTEGVPIGPDRGPEALGPSFFADPAPVHRRAPGHLPAVPIRGAAGAHRGRRHGPAVVGRLLDPEEDRIFDELEAARAREQAFRLNPAPYCPPGRKSARLGTAAAGPHRSPGSPVRQPLRPSPERPSSPGAGAAGSVLWAADATSRTRASRARRPR